MSYTVRPEKWIACICGKVCKGRAALANHGRKCPQERPVSGLHCPHRGNER